MSNYLVRFIIIFCLLVISLVESDHDYGLYHYNFDPDPLIDNCKKPEPLAFTLMLDFLNMIKAEAKHPSQECVLNGRGKGFVQPTSMARNILAVTTILYNTYARYSQNSNPTKMYEGWKRMSPISQTIPNCIYIYGFYQVADYLMPERLANYSFKAKYETLFNCNLARVTGNSTSELSLVQMDVDQLIFDLKDDGFNQDGCFADTTNFKPINPPCRLDTKATVEICRNYTHKHNTVWNYGEIIKSGYINTERETSMSFTQKCRPFALERLYDYLAPPYFQAPAFVNGTMMNLTAQFLELTDIQKTLGNENDKPKLLVEYWASGPNTTATPGHWQSISLNIVRRLCYDNENTLKLLFAVSAAIYDAGLAAWQNKRLYNSVRPITFIPTEFIDQTFESQFVGMYCGFANIEGWQWSPYQEDIVLTPDFQEYISGHSTFSRAASFILEKLTGSPSIPGNLSVTIKAGKSLFQPRCNRNESCYRTCRVNSSLNSENNYIPKVDVTLGPWKTYLEMANDASMSRRYGGIHISSGDIQGRLIGQKVSETVWKKILWLFNDTVLMTTSTTVTTTINTTISTSFITSTSTIGESNNLNFDWALYSITLIYYYYYLQ